MRRVQQLQEQNITPYIVFDGGPLPAKRGTEFLRAQRREKNATMARLLEANGDFASSRSLYAKSVDVTPEMTFQFIKVGI